MYLEESFEILFELLGESFPWFVAMLTMLLITTVIAWQQFIPLKWLPGIFVVIIAVTLGGFFLVPEDKAWATANNLLPFMLAGWLLLMFAGTRYQKKHNKGKVLRWQRDSIKESKRGVIKEIEYYGSLPYVFDGFMDVPKLSEGDMRITCARKHPAEPEKNWVPSYEFDIYCSGERIGEIRLRVGFTEGMYYSGHVGYIINEMYRGKGYAARACRLLVPVAKYHGMTKLLITNEDGNAASYRVCEKLGARFVRTAQLPHWHDMYEEGHRYMNIFEWDLDNHGN